MTVEGSEWFRLSARDADNSQQSTVLPRSRSRSRSRSQSAAPVLFVQQNQSQIPSQRVMRLRGGGSAELHGRHPTTRLELCFSDADLLPE